MNTAMTAAIITAAMIVAIGALRHLDIIDASIQDTAIAVLLGGSAGYSIGRFTRGDEE